MSAVTETTLERKIFFTTPENQEDSDIVSLWCIKDKKKCYDTFRIIKRYKHYYLLETLKTGVRFCVMPVDMNRNSRSRPVFFY